MCFFPSETLAHVRSIFPVTPRPVGPPWRRKMPHDISNCSELYPDKQNVLFWNINQNSTPTSKLSSFGISTRMLIAFPGGFVLKIPPPPKLLPTRPSVKFDQDLAVITNSATSQILLFHMTDYLFFWFHDDKDIPEVFWTDRTSSVVWVPPLLFCFVMPLKGQTNINISSTVGPAFHVIGKE